MIQTLLKAPSVQAALGLRKTAFYDALRRGLVTRGVLATTAGRSIAWPASEIAAIQGARIAGQTDDDVRQLVNALHAARCKAVASSAGVKSERCVGAEL